MTDALTAQHTAARPGTSTWVSANAGSGKTRVLTDRVARLLLAGTEPQKILCLTYTKAAAAEMQTRLFRTLGAWAMMPDFALRAALTTLGEDGAAIPGPALDHARTLFARALETPGGLRIQTIHAFCDALLRRFPLEAGVPPQFNVLEDRQARALRGETLDALARAGAPAYAAMAVHVSGDDPDLLLQEIDARREAFAAPFDPDGLRALLGLPQDLKAADLQARVLNPDTEALLAELAPILARGSKTEIDAACDLRAATAETLMSTLETLLLYSTGENAFTVKPFPTKATRAAHPALAARLYDLAARVEAARPLRLALMAFEKTAALNVFARIWIEAWTARKAASGLVEFDDLIESARRLLLRRDAAAWVLWRLDGGLDHILVDEAQDTSPAQWSVIEAISEEFFVGRSARDEVDRTLFVVGDEKQSIYSFQGADPREFGRMRVKFDRILDGMGAALATCDLLHSFRSAVPILRLVDAVFAGKARHIANAPEAPGRVELWPFLETEAKLEQPPWDAPLDMPHPADPAERVAAAVADRILSWLGSQSILPGTDRAIRAGDVLILVQRRGAVFDAVIRALKRGGVPVAGADVLRIGAELAVRDLLAALRVAVTSADDLSLAALLRSPLGGLSEEELFGLAHGRSGTLWEALATTAFPVRDVLRDLRGQADFLRPFELLQRVLIRHDGRRSLIARLGPEAEDGIDALLDQALAYERVEPPTLTGFLAWIDRDEVKVKRRSEDTADQVRVMTVHGAKGLEAPIVFLPDTAQRKASANPPQILSLAETAVWRVPAKEAPSALAAAEEARRVRVAEENRRLLYVALTRARTWLIVAGGGTAGPESWHAEIAAAIPALGPVTEPSPLGDITTLSHNWSEAEAPLAPPEAPEPEAPARTGPPPPMPLGAIRLVSPSALGGAHAMPGEGSDEATALARGTALHLLLETLPGRPRTHWPDLSARLLRGHVEAEALFAEACAVLDTPGLAFVFADGTISEAAVTAPLAELGGAHLTGRIDRLVVEPERILAVDFKSNRTIPSVPEDTPEAILRQMGAYAAALAVIYPGRAVSTAILWTRSATLMVLPPALTKAALDRAAQLDRATARP